MLCGQIQNHVWFCEQCFIRTLHVNQGCLKKSHWTRSKLHKNYLFHSWNKCAGLLKLVKNPKRKISLLVQRLFYGFFIAGYIVESLLFQPHPHKKNHAKCWREKKILGKCILQKKKSRRMNGLKKNHAYNKSPNPPLPSPASPGTLKSKVVGR